ncbi:hypothetical protein WCE55_00795 [Luteimonas sp. MJ293]|uniref:hypothetical protein n=1 Tax=Luteimonas sp. MJ146 TaxID=3129240 RepID=UPI0031BBBBA3
MSGPEIEAMRRLYSEPDDALVATLAAQLVDLGDCISSQLAELSRDPSRDRCDRVLHNLQGVIQHVRRLAAAQEVAR